MSRRRQTILGLALAAIAAGLLAASLKLPLWQMRMEAPQYRDQEALRVTIYPNVMTGDLQEISVLNQYIGVHIPNELPQLKWLPLVLMAGAVSGVGASLLPSAVRGRALMSVGLAVTLALAFAAGQAQVQMYEIGHKRDAKTKLARVKDFTPHVLGTSKLAQFTLTATLGPGSLLIGGALALQFAAAFVTCRRRAASGCCRLPVSERVLKLGSTGDPPVPVGDSPNGTAEGSIVKRPPPLSGNIASVSSGESPDGTGASPVLPKRFQNTLSDAKEFSLRVPHSALRT